MFVRKAFLLTAKSMIENRLTDKDFNNQNCFTQKRDLNNSKELLLSSVNFIDIILKKSIVKNISSVIYKMIK